MILLLKAAGCILLAILIVFMLYLIGLTVIYTVKSFKKEIKGGGRNDHNPEP